VSEAKAKSKSHRHKWIRSLIETGKTPEIVLLEEILPSADWKAREAHWIKSLRGNGLVNATSGGEGLIDPPDEVRAAISRSVSIAIMGNAYRKGIPHDEASKARISIGLKSSTRKKDADEARRGRPGRPLSEEARAKISKAKSGKKRAPFTAEHIENLRAAATGKKQSAETVAKRSASQIGNSRSKGSVRSEDAKRRISESRKSSKWITDGTQSKAIKASDPVPDGWTYGRPKKGK